MYSKCPYWVQNAVFHSSPGLIQIRLYADQMSSLVYIFALTRWSRASVIRGKGYQFLTVRWLSTL